MRRTYNVEGMTCGGCVKSVDKVARAAFPDAQIEVSLQAGTLTVDGEHDEAKVAELVEAAGFDFAGPV